MGPVEGDSPAGRRRVLVLGAGPAQIGLLQAAHERGLYVVAADRDPRAPGFRFADRRAIISVEDESGLDRLASAERVEGIVAPGLDLPAAIASRIAGRLGLPQPVAPQVAQLVGSKLRQRELLAEAGVPQARYRVCTSFEEARASAAELGGRCVVKAPDRQGQKGLGAVDDDRTLREAFEQAREAARGNVVLVEEFVDGCELTVNAFSVGGRYHPLTVTDRLPAETAFGVALAHVWPSDCEADQRERAVAAAAAAARALGITEGPTYTQVLLGPPGPLVGEVAARLGGGHDAELCEAALGVDLNGLALASALGEAVSAEALRREAESGGACVRFLVAPPGVLSRVEGLDSAREANGALWVRSYREPGFAFRELRHASDRAGAVLTVGSTRAQAIKRAERAAARTRFVTAPAQAAV
jgi:biotin carboxylase